MKSFISKVILLSALLPFSVFAASTFDYATAMSAKGATLRSVLTAAQQQGISLADAVTGMINAHSDESSSIVTAAIAMVTDPSQVNAIVTAAINAKGNSSAADIAQAAYTGVTNNSHLTAAQQTTANSNVQTTALALAPQSLVAAIRSGNPNSSSNSHNEFASGAGYGSYGTSNNMGTGAGAGGGGGNGVVSPAGGSTKI